MHQFYQTPAEASVWIDALESLEMETNKLNSVDKLRLISSRFYLIALWLLAGLSTFVAWLGDEHTTFVTGTGLVAAALGTWVILRSPLSLTARCVVSSVFATHMILLILAATHFAPEFVQEAHMLYFIVNCYLLGYACWRAIGVFNAIIVLHHLILTFALPNFIWSAGAADDGIIHFFIHGSIATILVIPLLYAAEKIRSTFIRNIKDSA